MIRSLQIQNFKVWEDTGLIKLAPITIFFGNNSSGKSSIGQFLMLLKQSIDMSDRRSVLFMGNSKSPVELKSPANMLNCHDSTRVLKFKYNWDTENSIKFYDILHHSDYSSKSMGFEAEIKVADAQNPNLEIVSFSYIINSQPQVNVGLVKQTDKQNSRGYKLTTSGYEFTRKTGRVWDIKQPMRFYGFPEEAVALYQNASLLLDVSLWHENLFSKISYLGPLRSRAERIYSWSGQIPASVNYSGEDTVAAILAAQSAQRLINYGNRQYRKEFMVVIAEMLQKMGLVDRLKIEKIAADRQEYEVQVTLPGSDIWMDVLDVGFGVSQVMPVIVQLFYAPAGSTIIMEQPELHLHPSAQAGLADVMISAIRAKENYADRNVQLIIETHSEHFLRRFQRRLAEEAISPDDIAAYVVQKAGDTAKLEPLQIDLFGEIKNWPDNFFGDITGDLYSQANAAINRRIKNMAKKND